MATVILAGDSEGSGQRGGSGVHVAGVNLGALGREGQEELQLDRMWGA